MKDLTRINRVPFLYIPVMLAGLSACIGGPPELPPEQEAIPIRRAADTGEPYPSLSRVPSRPREFMAPAERQALLDLLQRERDINLTLRQAVPDPAAVPRPPAETALPQTPPPATALPQPGAVPARPGPPRAAIPGGL